MTLLDRNIAIVPIFEDVTATALWIGLGLLSLSTSVGIYFWAFWRKKARTLETRFNEEISKERITNHSQKIALEESQQALKWTRDELINKEKLASLGTLSTGIAHEINNSLNYISGALGPLKEAAESLENLEKKEKLIKLYELISGGLEITLEIIKSLKTFSGSSQSKFKTLRVKEVVNTTLVLTRSKISDHIQVQVDIPEELSIYAHPVALHQIIFNLITNALDALDAGGTIEIRASAKRYSVLIQVKDTGTGISDDVKAKIFDPFFTTKEVGRGTGLGLHIVKQEVDRHQAMISVESQEGKGTTFSIEFPMVSDPKGANLK